MLIKKKEGAINELIYNQTVYNNGKNCLFPNLNNLNIIIEGINLIQSTCRYIYFNPFYYHAKLKCQIEFDDYLFYMECRDDFTEEELENHWTQHMDHIYDVPHEVKQYKEMSEAEQKQARILYPVCRHGDVQKFHEYLNRYQEYLYDELIPLLFKQATDMFKLSQEDMAFGYFCFEVFSD